MLLLLSVDAISIMNMHVMQVDSCSESQNLGAELER